MRIRHDAQVQIIEYKSIICPGFSCVLHVHSIVEDVTITHLIAIKDKKTGKPVPGPVKFVREGQTVFARLKVPRPICVETFEDFDQFGRFMLRDEGTPSPAAASTAKSPLPLCLDSILNELTCGHICALASGKTLGMGIIKRIVDKSKK